MTVPIEMDTYTVLGALRSQHDRAVNTAYRQGLAQRISIDTMANDPELVYHLDATEAIVDYLEAHDNP